MFGAGLLTPPNALTEGVLVASGEILETFGRPRYVSVGRPDTTEAVCFIPLPAVCRC
jgi:hypothetical protein